MEWYKSKKKEACQSLKAYFKLESRWQKWENIDHFIKRLFKKRKKISPKWMTRNPIFNDAINSFPNMQRR